MTGTMPFTLVVPPAVLPYRYGLLSAATVLTGAGRWELGVQFDSDNCTPGGLWGYDLCGDPIETSPPGKTAPGLTLNEAAPFTVYDGVTCAPIGLGDAEGRARRRLAGSEQRQVEAAFWTRQLAAADTPLVGGSPATGLAHAVGLLEEALGGNYNGLGVIHAPRWVAALAGSAYLAVRDGSTLRTQLDTAWAFGAGYPGTGPGGVAPAAGHAWLYVTGAVVVRRGDVVVPATPQAGGLDKANNEMTVLAERTYVVAYDCVAYAIDADLTGG
jgi:hypothetical protein